jgi:hypothetical protein
MMRGLDLQYGPCSQASLLLACLAIASPVLLISCAPNSTAPFEAGDVDEGPDGFDWRDVDGKDHATPAKDQGSYLLCVRGGRLFGVEARDHV